MKFRRIFGAIIAMSILATTACSDGGSTSEKPRSTTRAQTRAAIKTISTPAPSTTDEGTDKEENSAASTGEKREYVLADIHKDDYPTVMGNRKFAELVLEKTGGSISITVKNNAELGDEAVTAELTKEGEIHFNRLGTNILAGYNPKYNALSMPYLYRSSEHMFNVLDGEIGDEFLELLKDEGFYGLCWFDPGTRNFYNSSREIRLPSDMAGMKIRVQQSPLMMNLIELLGASPTPLGMNEVKESIENKLIDGAENNWPSYVSMEHNLAAKFITLDAHTRAPEMILVNSGVWESFSPEEQGLIKEAAKEAAIYQRQEWANQEDEYRKQAEDAGTTVTELTSDELKAFEDAVQPIYEQSEYLEYADLFAKIKAVE